MTERVIAASKPRYRGLSHLFGFFVVLGAAPVLVAFAPGGRATFAAAVYGLSLMTMLGASALYHRTAPPPKVEKWLERVDHAAIFIFIGGSYTPFALLVEDSAPNLLVFVWAGVTVGVLRALFWVDAPRALTVALYLLVGWTVVPFVAELALILGTTGVVLLGAGGLLYSGGAVIFALGRPNPYPGVFGFHEIFHAMVIVACVCHFIAVAQALHRLGLG